MTSTTANSSSHPIIYFFRKSCDREEYANRFIAGELFMHTLGYFQGREQEVAENKERFDKYEGSSAVYQPNTINLKIGAYTISGSDMVEPLRIQGVAECFNYVFCLSAASTQSGKSLSKSDLQNLRQSFLINKSEDGLGTHHVIVTDAQEFLKRCVAAIRREPFDGKCGLVTYFDVNTKNQRIPEEKVGFYKPIEYEWQREYRIMLTKPPAKHKDDTYILNVGDLSDIARLITPEKFNKGLKLILPDGSIIQ